MNVEIIETNAFSVVGLRVSDTMSGLDPHIKAALAELAVRKQDILNLKNPYVTYGITPPNYKGNDGRLDFYVCCEAEPIANVPHGMVHIRMPARLYAKTKYQGPASQRNAAYDYTTAWLQQNGYTYDDVDYYFEVYDQKTNLKFDDRNSEMLIYCPVKQKGD